MYPFTIHLLTLDGRSFGTPIESQMICECDGGAVQVVRIWVHAEHGNTSAKPINLLDPDVGSDAYRIGLMAKEQAEADIDFTGPILAEARERALDMAEERSVSNQRYAEARL